ncbi:MAG: pentapeptide repeat-containing protein, partial [Xenococcaceae cyanobacterium MO_167.B52]|nr:pentapeptide repeat-containing protein [Xenococcaceae cyanobacterium MO_167.B52]
RQQIIWLDCCHSGELLNFNEADPGEQGQARDRCFIAASREFEPVYQSLDSNYSVLTKVILDGLDPEQCPQKWITTTTLTDFINENLRHENQRPVFTNFGSPINLTRTLDAPISVSKGEDNDDICPYKGLEYFDFNDEDPKYFYGREKLTDKLIDRVRQNNFLAILGASGSGKSSLLRAGLLHKLKLGTKLAGSEDWKIKIMLPGQYPLQNLALSWLDSKLSDTKRVTELNKIKSLLKQGSAGLITLVQASTADRIILVIDQFEEAFTLCQDLAQREAFFQCLLEALEQTNNKLCLIMAMRIDFFGKCVEREYSGLSQIIQADLITILPMKQEELRQAIIKPAGKVKLSLESGLAETILKDIEGSPGSLPLLQDTLTELWKRRKDHQLKLTSYVDMGGVRETLNQRATEVYDSLTLQEQDCAKHIFLSLTALGEGTEDTLIRVLKQDLVTGKYDQPLIDQVMQKLAEEKLIVARNQVESDSGISQQPEVDVAHEALMRNWILLRQWLDECRDKLRQQRKIEDAAKYWKASGQKTDYLLSKKRLKEAKEFQQQQQEKYPLSELAAKFVSKSSKYQRKEKIKPLGIILIIPLIGTIIGGYFLIREIPFNADKKLIRDCRGKRDCPGRIEALENLSKAGKNIGVYNLRDAKLFGADLIEANLRDANLFGADLIEANLRDANLRYAELIEVNLRYANLRYAELIEANLRYANLSGADLRYANLRDAELIEANLRYANLRDAELIEANLRYANLRDAELIEAKLFGANLSGANLRYANLRYANLFGANLSGTNLFGANLSGVNFSGADLRYADLIETQNLTPSQIKSGCYWEKAFYKGIWDQEKFEGIVDEKANAEYIEELKKDQDSDPKEAVDCSRWE